jgi:hypothetical protein
MARFDYRSSEDSQAGRPGLLAERPELPYILPLFGFLLVMLPGGLGHAAGIDWEGIWKQYQPGLYAAKTLIAALLLWYFWPCYTRIRWNKLWLGALVGVLGTLAWIGTELLCQRIGISKPPDASEIYNPDAMIGGGWRESVFLCVRIAGPSLVVPLMEELFFRDWLMRVIISPRNFLEVPVGAFTWPSLLIMSVIFGINHGISRMFLAGVVYGLMMGVLLIRTKSLGACIVAHGVTNFTLYLYVIYSGDWQWM